MRIVIAPDSFKGSLSAAAAAEAIAAGLRRVRPDVDLTLVPMADGGEGTVESLVDATGGQLIHQTVTGPLGEPVAAFYGLLGDGKTAVLEMAAASGLPLVPDGRRDPRVTTTYGTGELVRAALDRGARRFIIGIGGSATNDGGAGFAQALGARLIGLDGQPLPEGVGGGALSSVARLDLSGLDPRLAECEFQVACDVDNPLCGPRGAAAVFGPQKGATPEMVAELDSALRHWARVLLAATGQDVLDLPGAGAAGGLGGGITALLGARLDRGVEIVIRATGLRELLKGADLVFTGEGRMDFQIVHGKTPAGVAAAAREVGAGPVIALVGGVGQGYDKAYAVGIDAVVPMLPGPMSLADAMAAGADLLADAAERAFRFYIAASKRRNSSQQR